MSTAVPRWTDGQGVDNLASAVDHDDGLPDVAVPVLVEVGVGQPAGQAGDVGVAAEYCAEKRGLVVEGSQATAPVAGESADLVFGDGNGANR